jgi:NAD(P)-dependent dehydrogenase (short-subunit alcohol dehydrogenase family)
MLLKNKVCVVTGVGSLRSIGFATAALFASHGAKVVALNLAVTDDVLAAIENEIANHAGNDQSFLAVGCDITDKAQCETAVAAAIDRFGTVDSLVHCAGIVGAQSILEISEQAFSTMISVNLRGTLNICQSILPELLKHGRGGTIVNVASLAAQRGGGLVGGGHYAASKGGMMSLTRTIAREFGPKNIRANIVSPAMIDTGMLDGNMGEDQVNAIVDTIPLRRTGHAADVAGACLFLASELSAYVTGATIDVNGGIHIH